MAINEKTVFKSFFTMETADTLINFRKKHEIWWQLDEYPQSRC